MTTYDFVHLAMLAWGKTVRGKTKLQKIIYFLGLVAGLEEDLGYRPHYYGPYSDEVAAAVGRLKALGFLDVSMSGGGAVDARGFEMVRHDYRLNESGRKIAESKKVQFAQAWDKLSRNVVALRKLLELDYVDLSIAAKTYFLVKEKNGKVSKEELPDLASRFGWSVTGDQVTKAAKHLQSVKLIEIT